MIALVIVIFVVGEMLWTPTSQALAAGFAPERLRGAYMGAYGGASTIAWSIGPLIALRLREAGGDAAMWYFFAAVALLGAATGAGAARLGATTRRPEPSERAEQREEGARHAATGAAEGKP
jgi:MFS family permease